MKGSEMRIFAALATVSLLLVGCNGSGESEEESTGAVAERGDEQGGGEDESDEQ